MRLQRASAVRQDSLDHLPSHTNLVLADFPQIRHHRHLLAGSGNLGDGALLAKVVVATGADAKSSQSRD